MVEKGGMEEKMAEGKGKGEELEGARGGKEREAKGEAREDGRRTSFSALCWKCTNATVAAAKSDVPNSVSFEARDMLGRRVWISVQAFERSAIEVRGL